MNATFQTAGETARQLFQESANRLIKGEETRGYYLNHPNVIHTTEQYDLFQFVKGNRDVDEQSVNRLGIEIKRNKQLVPILVDQDFQVIDGQHRLLACKKIGCAVRFIVQPNLGTAHMVAINSTSRNWKSVDYINQYAEQGKEAYIQLRDWINENSDFSINFAITVAKNSLRNHSYSYLEDGSLMDKTYANKAGKKAVASSGSDIKVGLFKSFDVKEARNRMRTIREIRNAMPAGVWKDKMGDALIQIMRIEEFNAAHLVHQLKGPAISQLRNPVSTEDAVKLIEDVYNYRRPHTSRLAIVVNPQRRAK